MYFDRGSLAAIVYVTSAGRSVSFQTMSPFGPSYGTYVLPLRTSGLSEFAWTPLGELTRTVVSLVFGSYLTKPTPDTLAVIGSLLLVSGCPVTESTAGVLEPSGLMTYSLSPTAVMLPAGSLGMSMTDPVDGSRQPMT